MRKFLVLLIASMSVAIASLPVTVVFAADEPGVSIENLMTAEELEATGVADLSGRQLKALNAWLQEYLRGDAGVPSVPAPATSSVQSKSAANDTTTAPPPDDSFGQRSKPVEMYSRIAGEFKGWTGKTRFPLENGQIWEQRKGWRWNITLDSPEVRIYKNFIGAYEMEIISEGRSIGVRRIK
jgi:hypothetical protein